MMCLVSACQFRNPNCLTEDVFTVEVQVLSLTMLFLLWSPPATVTNPHTASSQRVAMASSQVVVVAAAAATDNNQQRVAMDSRLATAMVNLEEEVAEAMANSQVVMASLKGAMEGGMRVKCPCVSVP